MNPRTNKPTAEERIFKWIALLICLFWMVTWAFGMWMSFRQQEKRIDAIEQNVNTILESIK